MRNFLCISLLFVTLSVFSQKKISGIVTYETKFSDKNVHDYLAKKREQNKNSSALKYLDDLLLNNIPVKTTLRFLDNEAIFEVNKKLDLNHGSNSIVEKLRLASAGGSKLFYTNTKTKSLEVQNCETLDECFIIVSKFKEWKLTQETKKIAGYLCYKATYTTKQNNTDIHVTAWYTPQIPVAFGPSSYNGLPGLILELENNFSIIRATKLTLHPKEKITIMRPTEGKKVSELEFASIVRKHAPSGLFKK